MQIEAAFGEVDCFIEYPAVPWRTFEASWSIHA